jgi:hypothetical protein
MITPSDYNPNLTNFSPLTQEPQVSATALNPTNLIQVAENQSHLLIHSLSKIESALQNLPLNKSIEELMKLDGQIKTTVKLLKRSMKGESNLENITKIDTCIKRIESSFKQTIGTLKHAVPLGERTAQQTAYLQDAAKMIRSIAQVESRAAKKMNILQHRVKFQGEQKLERFDYYIESLMHSATGEQQLCFAKLHFTLNKIQQKNEPVINEDLNNLKKIQKIVTIKSPEEQVEFASFIQGVIDQIQQSIEIRKTLLQELCADVRQCKMDHEYQIPPEDKLKFIIWFKQIINHPFEIPLNISEISELKELENDFYKLISKKTVSTTKLPYSKETLGHKIEGLKRISAQAAENPANQNDNILISGAGPGGLMLALGCALQGKPFTLIETRSSTQKMRENVVALGKEDDPSNFKMLQSLQNFGDFRSADLKLLDFFGITDFLITEEGLAEHKDSDSLFKVKIKDLQNGMLELLRAMTGKETNQLILYDTEIKGLEQVGNKAEITLQVKGQLPAEKKISPSLVYVMEGYRTKTRDLLGIDTIKESKATRMGVAFFKTTPANLIDSCSAHLRALPPFFSTLPSLFKLLIDVSVFQKEIDVYEGFFHALGRAELALSTPETRYFYFTILSKESENLKKLEEGIALAVEAREEWADAIEKALQKIEDAPDLRNKFKEANRKKWIADAAEIRKVLSSLESLAERLPALHKNSPEEMQQLSLLTKQLGDMHQQVEGLEEALEQLKLKIMGSGRRESRELIDTLTENKSLSPASYQSMDIPYSQVQRAETNLRTLGSTVFCVGGDAESATDPTSGSGLRTTLLRTVTAASAFQNPQIRTNRLMHSAFDASSNLIASSMREEGLHLRQTYMTGTERLERYISMAESAGVLDSSQRELLLKWEAKAKAIRDYPDLGVQFSETEKQQIAQLQSTLKEKYQTHIKNQQSLSQPQWNERAVPTWTQEEKAVFKKAYDASMKGEKIDVSPQKFQKAAAKLAIQRPSGGGSQLHYPEAWFVSLTYSLQQLGKRVA